MSDSAIQTWRSIIQGDEKSWVLFAHGTCVILMEPAADPAAQAVAILRKWGPVHAGSPAGDFSVIELSEHPGWVVTGHHPDVLTYVGPDEVDGDGTDLTVGVLGRSKRDRDAAEAR
jgi:hypothetical protein